MDLSVDDIDIIPALPPINEDDFNDGEDRTFANENIKCPGTAITSKSLKEQSNKNDYLASLPTLSRDERMPGETEEVTTKSVIEDSIQGSYEIVNKSNSLLADSDSKYCNESFSFKGSPLPSGEERAISSGKRNYKCVANNGYSAEDHLDSSVQDAHVAEDDGNNEAKTSTADAGALETNGMSGKSGSYKMKRMKSADENVMHLTDDDSEIAASWMNSNPQDKMIFRYYAVRVGYARASYFFEDLDSVETEKEMRHFSKSVPMVKIRSAIFLYWDDACQFVENIENLDQDSSLEVKVEYEGFDSIAEAEAYLLELDTHLAWEHATSFGMTCPEVNDHKQIPATSNYSGFHYQYPVPQLYIPHSFPLVPSASGLNTEPTALGDHSPQLLNFSSVSSHGVPNARDMNSEPASVVTRSKAKLKKTSVTETPLSTKTSNPSRGRPKTVTKRQIVRPRPKKLTVREMEEQKRANINPATSHLYGFHGQYPVPRYYIPHPSLLTHDANELDIQPTMFGTTPAELLHFATLPSHIVPGDREMNLAPASIETRSKSKLNETPIPEAQIPKSKSRPTRGRPKVVRRKPLLRPQPKKLTAKEKEELKKANMEEKWDKMFAKLLDYKEKNDGSLDIPAEVEGAEGDDDCEGIANLSISEKKELQRLRRWCVLQKRHYRQWIRGQNASEFFTDQKYSKLKDAGFEFSALTWDEQYEKLKAYKDAHGTLKVEKEHDEDLFKWAYKQRRILGKHFEGKSVRLTKERLNKLIDLGWQKTAFKQRRIHDPADEERKWDEKYQKLLQYIEKNGHMMFPNSNISHEDTYLRTWVAMIRQEYQKLQNGSESNLTAVKIKKLADIGFDFNPRGIPGNRTREARWEANLQALKDYKARHGDFTQCKKDDRKVVRIISKMREQYKRKQRGERCGLTDERVAQLEEIGFDFQRVKSPKVSDRRSWEERFQQLLEYKEKHGHCMVPRRTGGVLGQWVLRQRVHYKLLLAGEPSSLTHEKALRLSSIGFCFDASSRFKGTKRDNTNYTRPIFSQRKEG